MNNVLDKIQIVPWVKSQVQVIAACDIPKGELVMQEEPLLSIKHGNCIKLLLALLNDEEKLKEFNSWNLYYKTLKFEIREEYYQIQILRNEYPGDIVKLWQQVAINAIRAYGVDGLFKFMSRVNHSCHPNCELTEDFKLVAIKKIKKGDEITYHYFQALSDTEEIAVDKNILYYLHGFLCRCSSCKILSRPKIEREVVKKLRSMTDILVEVNW